MAVTPFATMVAELGEAGYAADRLDERTRSAVPAVGSAAMAELSQQAEFAGVWDEAPIDTAQAHIGLLLTAGEDAMQTFAAAITADRTPLYAYVPIARAGLECLALAHYLGEPGIGAKERIRRSINERIASAYEQERLPGRMNPEPGRRKRLLEAVALGYTKTGGKKRLTVLGTERPTVTHHIQRVLGNDDLGKALYSYASAISHGTLWGLAARAEPVKDVTAGPVVTAALLISSDNIAMMAIALASAHIRAYGGYVIHMGWGTERWIVASTKAKTVISNYLAALGNQRPEVASAAWTVSTPGGLWLP